MDAKKMRKLSREEEEEDDEKRKDGSFIPSLSFSNGSSCLGNRDVIITPHFMRCDNCSPAKFQRQHSVQ